METILPIFEFDDIPQEEKFVHKCEINSSEHYNKIIDHNDCYSIKLQELLLFNYQ